MVPHDRFLHAIVDPRGVYAFADDSHAAGADWYSHVYDAQLERIHPTGRITPRLGYGRSTARIDHARAHGAAFRPVSCIRHIPADVLSQGGSASRARAASAARACRAGRGLSVQSVAP